MREIAGIDYHCYSRPMATVSLELDQPTVVRTGRRIALALLVAFIGLFALDAALFRTHLYPSVLEPDSSAGYLQLVLWREKRAQPSLGDNLVVTVGDSRFAYAPRIIDQSPVNRGYVFRSAGVAGTNALVWYYLLRDLDPTARRYRALVIGVDDYDDEDVAYQPDNVLLSMHYSISRLRLSDVFDFASSYHDRKVQWEAFRGALLKGIVYQSDILAFLAHPRKRIAYVRLVHSGFAHWTYDYVESSRTMVGLQIDWSTLKATYPAEFTQEQRDSVRGLVHAPFPQTGRLAAYRRRWFGKIIDYYRGSSTKIIFIRLPRGPLVRPDNLVRKMSSSIREFASRPGVFLVDEHAFDSLEHPELFKDAVHLNREGVARLSLMLQDEVARILGPPGQRAAK